MGHCRAALPFKTRLQSRSCVMTWVVDGYQCFTWMCCFYLQVRLPWRTGSRFFPHYWGAIYQTALYHFHHAEYSCLGQFQPSQDLPLHFRVRLPKNLVVKNLIQILFDLFLSDSGDRIPVGARFSSPVHTSPGALAASCTMGTVSFPGGKAAGLWCSDPPPIFSAEV